MKQILINNIGEDVHFHSVYGLYQRWWKKKSFFSYLSTPRPNHGLMYILSENVQITLKDGKQMNFKFGDILYLPKGLYYSIKFSDKNAEFYSLLINFSMYKKDEDELSFYKDATLLVSSASAKYSDIFYTIINQSIASLHNKLSIMSAFYTLLDLLAQHQEKCSHMDDEYKQIAPATIYIDNHVNENPPIPELAKMCMMSESCFRKHFKKCTKMSPAQYKIKVKILKAKQMLKTDTITTDEIVTALGFYDLSYFYKIFKKETGLTPAEYLQKQKSDL